MFVVLLGAPGAGKGTQAKIVSERIGLPHVSSGDLFREALAKETRLGRLVKPYLESGRLVPDDLTTEMVVERLLQPDCENGALLDGYPRTVEQARSLDAALGARGLAVHKTIYIAVDPEELVRRLSGRWICRRCQTPFHETDRPPNGSGICDVCGGELYQRPDDTEETVRRRLRIYFEQTAPLENYYRARGILVEVDGQRGVEEVARDLLVALGVG